ncbi:MAG: Gfo/Idh/MocA family oxidoreductase, partial [Leptolyngbya sp. SIO4C5]|nr:Gfo/Idh/MocA family oxidoreductase [Leptolyngbya sp. SIO4C5]
MATETSTLGVAVIGTGFGQKIHIPGLQAHHRTRPVAVYHRDLDKAKAIAQAHDIPHACPSVEAALALPEVEAVAVSTPPFLHYPMAKMALEAGKHLLLEKPTTLSAAEARELNELAQARNLIGVMDFEFRFVPAWQRLAELLAAGYVGNKRLIKIDWLAGSRANPDRSWNWYALKDKGGGALGAIGSHAFDYIAWLFGPVQQLCARLSTTITQRPDPVSGELKPVDADDTCTLMLDLQDGTPCQMALSAVAYEGRGHWLEIYGDRGTLVLGSSNSSDYVHGFKLYGAPAGEPLTELEIPERLAFPQTYEDGRLAPFIRVVNHWVDCIDRGQVTALWQSRGC